MTTLQHVWYVRAGFHRELESEIEMAQAIATGWPEMGDLSSLTTYEGFKECYGKAYPEETTRNTATNAGQIYTFVQVIKNRDFIVTSASSGKAVLIGVVDGPYEYRSDLFSGNYPHVRKIRWLKRKRLYHLSNELQRALSGEMAVATLDAHLDEIQALAMGLEDAELLVVAESTQNKGIGYWAALAGIVGTIIACIALLPQLIDFGQRWWIQIQDPDRYLILERVGGPASSYDYYQIAIQEDPQRAVIPDWFPFSSCSQEERCFLLVYIGDEFLYTKEFWLEISSGSPDSPLIIQGIELTLNNYQDIDDSTLDLDMILLEGRGGGGPGRNYVLSVFPIPIAASSSPQLEFPLLDPQRAVGESVLGTLQDLSCEDDRDCVDTVFLKPDEVEHLDLGLDFLKSLPSGWYDFEVKVAYTYEGYPAVSEQSARLVFVKPERVTPWIKQIAPVEIALSTGDLTGRIADVPLPNPPGFLVLRSEIGLGEIVFIWDLQTGQVMPIGPMEFYTHNYGGVPFWDPPVLSPQGQLLVSLIPSGEDQLPTTDLRLTDIGSGRLTRITNTPLVSEVDASWSPNGTRVAYAAHSYAFEQEQEEIREQGADVYIYDVAEATTHQITTSAGYETEPFWLGEERIAFRFQPADSAHADSLRIVNLDDGEISEVTDLGSEDRLSGYLSNLDLFVLDAYGDRRTRRLLHPDGTLYLEFPVQGSYVQCRMLDTLPVKEVCEDYQGFQLLDVASGSISSLGGPKPIEGGPFLGNVSPDGFIIADLANNVIEQYAESGEFLRDWAIPADFPLYYSGMSDMMLVPSSIP